MYRQLILKVLTCSVISILIISCKKDKGNADTNGTADTGLAEDSSYSPLSPPVVYLWTRLPGERKTGELGGIDEANGYCESEGETRDFETPVMSHRVMLSDSSQDARRFFENDPPVKRPDGTEIIDRYTKFFDSMETLKNNVANVHYWTGISDSGAPASSSHNCDGWTNGDPASSGAAGNGRSTDGARFFDSNQSCETRMYILCVSS